VNQFTPLLQVANNWYLEIAPSPVEHIAARLRVTVNQGGVLKDEVIELPPISKQTWMFIAILRDGRRFDVIYQNRIVASQRLEHYPVVISSPLSVGNKGLAGTAAHIMIQGERLTPTQVSKERDTHIDTNGAVIEDIPINMSLPFTRLFADCPSGFPCDTITAPPKNNTMEWRSPYA